MEIPKGISTHHYCWFPFHTTVVYLHSPCWGMFPFHDAVVSFLHDASNFSFLEDMWRQSPVLTACHTELNMSTVAHAARLGVFVPVSLLSWKHTGTASWMPVEWVQINAPLTQVSMQNKSLRVFKQYGTSWRWASWCRYCSQRRAGVFLAVTRTGLGKRLYELLGKLSFYSKEILYWAIYHL